MKRGILLVGGSDPAVESRAAKYQLDFTAADAYSVPFEKTLILQAGIRVPWDLLPAAWAFLDRWDAAVPLWRYGESAADLGSKAERKITQDIILDLRVLLYSHELLFVRKNERGLGLIDQWVLEMARGPDPRLAFLRAYFAVKPLLCTLPISWLAEVRSSSAVALRSRHPRIGKMKKGKLVRVEISPGRFVKCEAGNEDRIRAFYADQGKN